MTPKVSVIVPVYNQAAYVAEAIQSVIKQTSPNWEMVVVDDGSTDSTAEVVAQFDDPRIHYLFQANRGLPGARNTGITHSSGEYLAFLDADDLYHPDKLTVQVAHLDQNPEIGLSYTSRIGIDHQGNQLTLYRAPEEVSLRELVLGFPFTINDLLVRRHWVEGIGNFDESFLLNSEDRDLYLRLALNGCRFAGVGRFLAYRRFHSSRTFNKIPEKMATYFRSLETAFADPRCPEGVLELRDDAYGEVYKVWAYQALVQGETELGHEYLYETVRLNPTLFNDKGLNLLQFFIWSSIRDGGDYEEVLRALFTQLPPELAWLSEQANWAVAQAAFLHGIRNVMWGRLEQAQTHFSQSVKLGFSLDERFLPPLTDQVLNYEAEFGPQATHVFLQNLAQALDGMQGNPSARRLHSDYSLSRAFIYYQTGEYSRVPRAVIEAISRNPMHLTNRGVWAITVRSVLGAFSHTRV